MASATLRLTDSFDFEFVHKDTLMPSPTSWPLPLSSLQSSSRKNRPQAILRSLAAVWLASNDNSPPHAGVVSLEEGYFAVDVQVANSAVFDELPSTCTDVCIAVDGVRERVLAEKKKRHGI